MDSDEEEIFFGPVTAKEEQIAAKYHKRKTVLIHNHGTSHYRHSAEPYLPSMNYCLQEDDEDTETSGESSAVQCHTQHSQDYTVAPLDGEVEEEATLDSYCSSDTLPLAQVEVKSTNTSLCVCPSECDTVDSAVLLNESKKSDTDLRFDDLLQKYEESGHMKVTDAKQQQDFVISGEACQAISTNNMPQNNNISDNAGLGTSINDVPQDNNVSDNISQDASVNGVPQDDNVSQKTSINYIPQDDNVSDNISQDTSVNGVPQDDVSQKTSINGFPQNDVSDKITKDTSITGVPQYDQVSDEVCPNESLKDMISDETNVQAHKTLHKMSLSECSGDQRESVVSVSEKIETVGKLANDRLSDDKVTVNEVDSKDSGHCDIECDEFVGGESDANTSSELPAEQMPGVMNNCDLVQVDIADKPVRSHDPGVTSEDSDMAPDGTRLVPFEDQQKYDNNGKVFCAIPRYMEVCSIVTPPGSPCTRLDVNIDELTITPPPSNWPHWTSYADRNPKLAETSHSSTTTNLSSLPNSEQTLSDQCSESSYIESYGSVNTGMVASHTSDSFNRSAAGSSLNSPNHYGEETARARTVVQENVGLRTQDTFSRQPCATSESCDTSAVDSMGTRSPSPRFNDTLEEVEMLLKYGLNYGESTQDPGPLPEPQSQYEPAPAVMQVADEPDHLLSRKGSVCSTISSFQPVMESTRASTIQQDFNSPRGLAETPSGCKESTAAAPTLPYTESPKVYTEITHKAQGGVKKEPPPKPPRSATKDTAISKNLVCVATPKNASVRPVKKALSDPRHTSKATSYARTMPKKITTPGVVSKDSRAIQTPKQSSVKNVGRITPGPRSPPRSCGSGPVSSIKSHQKARFITPPAGTQSLQKACNPTTPGVRYTPKTSKMSKAPLVKALAPAFGLPPVPTPTKRLKPQNTPLSKGSSAVQRMNKQTLKHPVASPLAKYLKDNPPPPLVQNVKPRHKISPQKMQTAAQDPACGSLPPPPPPPLSEDGQCTAHPAEEKQATTLTKIRNDLESLSLKIKSEVCSEKGETVKVRKGSRQKQVLPQTVYTPAAVLVTEEDDKENEKHHRLEVLTDKQQPVLVFKHKGRMRIHKTVYKEAQITQDMVRNSPGKKELPSLSGTGHSARVSLMEVSVIESHTTEHTHTLERR